MYVFSMVCVCGGGVRVTMLQASLSYMLPSISGLQNSFCLMLLNQSFLLNLVQSTGLQASLSNGLNMANNFFFQSYSLNNILDTSHFQKYLSYLIKVIPMSHKTYLTHCLDSSGWVVSYYCGQMLQYYSTTFANKDCW